MPRTYQRKVGSRQYKDYEDEQMEMAEEAVRSGKSIRQAALEYKVKREALRVRMLGEKPKAPGGQTALDQETEESLVKYLLMLSEWGFPITFLELRLLVKSYLQRIGCHIKKFPDGVTPGKEWAKSFMSRHANKLSSRLVQNINPKRAQVDSAVINSYFDYMEADIEGIPPENIINFDETNLSDDPGRIKAISKRGQKYFDRLLSTSKSSTSIMFAATASGYMLPPFVVYKAQNVYDLWIMGGPKGTRYSCSSSGWFEATHFEEWFFSLALPYIRKLKTDKKVVLIGDNLSSHFSVRILQTCLDNNILFKCLPPHSTHICQPLDVALFAPMKKHWRQIFTK